MSHTYSINRMKNNHTVVINYVNAALSFVVTPFLAL